jgi:acetylglutamate kinase
MNSEIVEIFGKTLVKQVRDVAIQSLVGELNYIRKKQELFDDSNNKIRWIKEIRDKDIDKLIERVIVDTVDETIFKLLFAIDEGFFDIIFSSYENPESSLKEYSEEDLLCAPYITEWRVKFSKEQYYEV